MDNDELSLPSAASSCRECTEGFFNIVAAGLLGPTRRAAVVALLAVIVETAFILRGPGLLTRGLDVRADVAVLVVVPSLPLLTAVVLGRIILGAPPPPRSSSAGDNPK
jgi:hypothetical protein